jgi:hypothetical protein
VIVPASPAHTHVDSRPPEVTTVDQPNFRLVSQSYELLHVPKHDPPRVHVQRGRCNDPTVLQLGQRLTKSVPVDQRIRQQQSPPNPHKYDYYVVHFDGARTKLLVSMPYCYLPTLDCRDLYGALTEYYALTREPVTWTQLFPDSTGYISDDQTVQSASGDSHYSVPATLVFDHDESKEWVPVLPDGFVPDPGKFYGDGVADVGGFFPGYRLIAARGEDYFCSALFHWHGMFFFYDAPKERVLPLGCKRLPAMETMLDIEEGIFNDDMAGWVGITDIWKYGASHFFDQDRPIIEPDRRFQAPIDEHAAAEWHPYLPESFHIPPAAFHGDTPGLVEMFFKGYKLIAARGPGDCIGALFQWRDAFFYWDCIEDRALPLSADRRRARQILWDMEEDRPLCEETRWLSWGDLAHHAAEKLFHQTADGYSLKWPLQ